MLKSVFHEKPSDPEHLHTRLTFQLFNSLGGGGGVSVVIKCVLCNTNQMLLDWNQQSFSQYEPIIICIRLDLFSSEGKKMWIWLMCPCGRFPMQPTVQGSDKVDVEAIYCPSVLDKSATGEILDRFSVLLDRVYVENLELEQKKKKKRLLSHLPFLNIPSKTDQGLLIDKLLLFSPRVAVTQRAG